VTAPCKICVSLGELCDKIGAVIQTLPEEQKAELRRDLLARAQADLARLTPILAQRERERLLRMKSQTDLIQ